MRYNLNALKSSVALIVISIFCAACSSSKVNSPYTTKSADARDPNKAQALTMRAADMIATDPVKAEELLRLALAADLFYGPAHNDLGVLMLRKSLLFEAANEFEWARKLMPGHPDPRMNLALT